MRDPDIMPLIIPAIGNRVEIKKLFKVIDGLLLTGSVSHLHPSHYGETPVHLSKKYDRRRDATTIPLIPAALDAGMPLFAICRGFHELNVAHGGALYQEMHTIEGFLDHRQPDEARSYQEKYRLAHEVSFKKGGYLNKLTGKTTVMVNSLHHQGIKELGRNLIAEAWSSDGAIEAVRVKGAANFALGVQWHPEWLFGQDSVSEDLFGAFFEAVKSK